ncbi:hypothetical protein GCM10029976_073750 [Kribbella albertanoniae]
MDLMHNEKPTHLRAQGTAGRATGLERRGGASGRQVGASRRGGEADLQAITIGRPAPFLA